MDSFERNRFYAGQKTLKVGRRDIRYVPMRHEEGEKTALFVPGFATRLRGMAGIADMAHKYGYNTVSMAHDHIGDECPEDVMAMIKAIKDGAIVGDDKTDLVVIAHSLGAIHSIRAMSSRDDIADYVKGLGLLAPTGFGGVHPGRVIHSIIGELVRRPVTEHARDMTLEALEYMVRAGPGLIRKVRETKDVRVIDETRALREERGVPLAAILYLHDQLVRYDEVRQGLGMAGLEGTFDIIDGYAGHNAHLMHPERVGIAMLNMLGYLQDGDLEDRNITPFITGADGHRQ